MEGHWDNLLDMSSQHKGRFFDGTLVLHRHLDQLLENQSALARDRAYTDVRVLICGLSYCD